MGERSTKEDVNPVREGAHIFHGSISDLREDNAHKSDKMLDTWIQPHTLGEFTQLYMLSMWKEPDILTPRITKVLVFPNGL